MFPTDSSSDATFPKKKQLVEELVKVRHEWVDTISWCINQCMYVVCCMWGWSYILKYYLDGVWGRVVQFCRPWACEATSFSLHCPIPERGASQTSSTALYLQSTKDDIRDKKVSIRYTYVRSKYRHRARLWSLMWPWDFTSDQIVLEVRLYLFGWIVVNCDYRDIREHPWTNPRETCRVFG